MAGRKSSVVLSLETNVGDFYVEKSPNNDFPQNWMEEDIRIIEIYRPYWCIVFSAVSKQNFVYLAM